MSPQYRLLALLITGLCVTMPAIAPHAAYAFTPGPPVSPPPTVTADAPTTNVYSTSLSGAPLTVTAGIYDATSSTLNVTLSVDGTPVSTQTVTGSGSQTTAVSVPLTYTYPVGTHTITITVFDGTQTFTTSTSITVVTPATTLGAKVTGGGSILVDGGKATFGLVAMCTPNGVTKGNWTYQDHVTGHMVKSTQITSVFVSGTHARIFGKAMIDDDADVDFCLDVDDLGEPGNGVDKFQVALSNGYFAGGTVTDGGNIQIH